MKIEHFRDTDRDEGSGEQRVPPVPSGVLPEDSALKMNPMFDKKK